MEHATLGGEVWTDERGAAVVVLPPYLQGRELEYEYELHHAEPTDASAELADGRLTIRSGAPHLKLRGASCIAPRQVRGRGGRSEG